MKMQNDLLFIYIVLMTEDGLKWKWNILHNKFIKNYLFRDFWLEISKQWFWNNLDGP